MPKYAAGVAQLSPATTNSDKVGDARFVNSTEALIGYDSNTLDVGVGSAKNAVRYGSVAHFDTGPIPLGAKIDKARFALHSSASESESMTVDIAVLALTTRLDSVERQFHDGRLIYMPASGIAMTSLWDLGSTSGGQSLPIVLSERQQDGVGSISQTWIANTSDEPLTRHWFVAKRLLTNSDTRVRVRVYTAKGSAGSYYKGALVLDGELTDISGWTSGNLATRSFDPVHADWYPTEGEVYVTEIELIPSSTPAGTVHISWNSTYDGSVQNETTYAAEGAKIQGFGGSQVSAQWEDGIAIKNADHVGTIDTVSFPSMTLNTTYSFGSSEYTGITQLSNFKSNLQTTLDNRTSTDQWIGLRLQNWSSTEGEIRIFHSIAAGELQSADTLPGFKGPVLEVHYTLPHQSVLLTGSASSVTELVGSGTSAVALTGAATSVAALTGSGTSTHLTLSGLGVSRKELNT